MSEWVLDVRRLQVVFPGVAQPLKAVDEVSFGLARGQTLGIVGESGSGKSMTALALMGLVPSPGQVRGEVWFQGDPDVTPIDLQQLSAKQWQQYRGEQMAMIFQEPLSSLNPVYTVGFQLMEAIQFHQTVSGAEARRQAIALLQEVKLIPSDEVLRTRYQEEFQAQHPGQSLPEEREVLRQINQQKLSFLDRYPHELSGGQIQRVMIAMAICSNPTLLIADEPTTALDVTVQATILDLLRELRDRRGMSILFISHDLGVIAAIADTVAVMYQGQIVEMGTLGQIFAQPQHPYTQGLLACRPRLDRPVRVLPTIADFMERAEPQVAQSSPSHDSSRVPMTSEVWGDEVTVAERSQRLAELQTRSPLLRVENLQVTFPVRGIWGGTQQYVMAVNRVFFEVYPGETLGLVGESGCGKTTLARTLLRLIQPSQGEIWFENRDILQLPSRELRQLRREIQIIFQDPFSALDPRMSVGAAVMEPLQIHGVGKSDRVRRERAIYLLERVGLTADAMKRYPHEFSGGQRQRICVARALALNPKFIICDESVSALDVSVQAQVLNLLKEVQAEFGLTYIFISHDLSVVKFMSDRIMVMNRGKIEEIGPAEQIYREPQQPYTRQLISAIPQLNLEALRH